ncbi:hypothetical protein PD5205_02957 [Xanthomonas fragariae]|uniref:Uncharacterized protein n=1 Tax=Xanthomonas fragariae TaxID=48664 RepID=A0A1Y6HL71_9XANT|nr:hypothetical protein PD885_01038 [Xanthomonas fragariae]SMR04244.1 hypothetical protein PD5205_02957 [Xanthomonas fragariae]
MSSPSQKRYRIARMRNARHHRHHRHPVWVNPSYFSSTIVARKCTCEALRDLANLLDVQTSRCHTNGTSIVKWISSARIGSGMATTQPRYTLQRSGHNTVAARTTRALPHIQHQSLLAATRMACTTTMTVLPAALGGSSAPSSACASHECNPADGSSITYTTPNSCEQICMARRRRCSSPGDNVGVLRFRLRSPRPSAYTTSIRAHRSAALRCAAITCSGCRVASLRFCSAVGRSNWARAC